MDGAARTTELDELIAVLRSALDRLLAMDTTPTSTIDVWSSPPTGSEPRPVPSELRMAWPIAGTRPRAGHPLG